MAKHGLIANGIRKVELTDNLGRVNTIHVSPEGTLRDAIGDPWKPSKADDSKIAMQHWRNVRSITARCGDEVAEFIRSPHDWLAAPIDENPQ